MNKIRKGDEVIVITGKDKGRRGIVLSVLNAGKKLLVEGINTVKKHTRPNPNTGDRGGIVIKTMPIDRSNVMVYDPVTGKGSRIGVKISDTNKTRYFKSTGDNVEVG